MVSIGTGLYNGRDLTEVTVNSAFYIILRELYLIHTHIGSSKSPLLKKNKLLNYHYQFFVLNLPIEYSLVMVSIENQSTNDNDNL